MIDRVKEKLVELLTAIDGICPKEASCYDCEYKNVEHCAIPAKADYLIANGVTVQEWISVNDRLPKAEDALTDGSVYAYTKAKNVLVLHYKYVCRRSDYILYWMPIAMPQPPKEVEK